MNRYFICLAFLLSACGDTPAEGPPNSTPANANTSANTEPGDAIDTQPEAWEWVEFPDSKCANGQPTGIAVNQTDRSDDLLVFFQGGGACWDVNTCFVLNSAVNIESGYTAARLDNEPILNWSAFDRDNADSPFRDMNWVFVPYCTGDLHAGDNVRTYTALGQNRDLHHVGAANVSQFLSRLDPTFSDAPRVFVSGSSAGAYGAQLNFHRFRARFPGSEVHLLSDSGPLVQPYGGRYGEWQAAWSLQAPEDCVGCTAAADGMTRWFDYLLSSFPDSRFGLLLFDADQVIQLFFAYPLDGSFTTELERLVTQRYQPATNAAAFVRPGTQHVMFNGLNTIAASDGTALSDWVQGWVDGTAWQTVGP